MFTLCLKFCVVKDSMSSVQFPSEVSYIMWLAIIEKKNNQRLCWFLTQGKGIQKSKLLLINYALEIIIHKITQDVLYWVRHTWSDDSIDKKNSKPSGIFVRIIISITRKHQCAWPAQVLTTSVHNRNWFLSHKYIKLLHYITNSHTLNITRYYICFYTNNQTLRPYSIHS